MVGIYNNTKYKIDIFSIYVIYEWLSLIELLYKYL